MDQREGAMRSVDQIPNFPFATFEEFTDAYAADRALVWTSNQPGARRAVWTASERRLSSIWTMSPAWIAAGFAASAWLLQAPWLLFGVPAALLAFGTAAPNLGLINGCLSFAAAAAALVAAIALGHGELVAVSFGACAALVARSAGLGAAHAAIRLAMLQSEAAFLWLYKQGAITNVIRPGAPPVEDASWPPAPTHPQE